MEIICDPNLLVVRKLGLLPPTLTLLGISVGMVSFVPVAGEANEEKRGTSLRRLIPRPGI